MNGINDSSDDTEYNSDEGMDFCRGMSMTMSMGGFQSALFSRGHADCITFLFAGWKLDHPGKFVGAMIGTFVLAVFTEGISRGQIHVRNTYMIGKTDRQRKTVMTVLYGFQQLMGWMLMLVSMTFSIELFASVIMGLFVGKLLFPAEIRAVRQNRSAPTTSSDPLLDIDSGIVDHSESSAMDRPLPEESSAGSSPSTSDSSGNAIRRRRR